MLTERKSGLGSRRVRDIMTGDPACVRESDGIVEAARIMKREDAGVVPIVDGDRKLVGIVSMGDLAVETNEKSKVGDVVQDISEARPNN